MDSISLEHVSMQLHIAKACFHYLQEVSALDFHPQHMILASGSKDHSIRFFEFSKPSVKKAYKSIQEASEVTTMSFHPSGDFLLVGTQHPTCEFSPIVLRSPENYLSYNIICIQRNIQSYGFVLLDEAPEVRTMPIYLSVSSRASL